MFLEEYWGKKFLAEAGIKIPRGRLARTPAEAAAAARDLGGSVVVKAQVIAGGRGKSGGILFADSADHAEHAAQTLLGSSIHDRLIEHVLIEERVASAAELYVAITNDTLRKRPIVMCSARGGMEIEDAHAKAPAEICMRHIDIRRGLDAAQAVELIRPLRFAPSIRDALADLLERLYRLYRSTDAQLVEVNPLAITSSGTFVALDCKLVIDDSAVARHPNLQQPTANGTALERRAKTEGLLYVELDGQVGVLANGAGLTMATLDAINYFGGRPANFMEIGGDAYHKAEAALSIVLANPRVNSLLVNLCGAFARTDVIIEGIVAAWEKLRPTMPVAFSIHGTGERQAIQMVRERLSVEPHDVMEDAVRAAVAAAYS